MPSPNCTVNDLSTTNGVDVSPGAAITIQLSDLTGVTNWSIQCIYTDENQSASVITASLSINNTTRTATFTAPSTARGSALIFQSKVNNGIDLNGAAQSSYTTRFGIFAVGTSGLRLLAANQTTEGDADFGWISSINPIIELGGAAPSATTTTSGTIVLTNDLGGTYDAPSVVGLQGHAIDDTALTSNEDGYSLVWNDGLSQWEAQYVGASVSDATASVKGVVQLAGDLAGTGSTAAAPITSGINGATVPASGALTTGHLLKVSGVAALSYGYLTNSSVDAAAAIDGSKISPDFGAQTVQTTGSLSAATSSGSYTLGRSNSTNSLLGSVKFTTRTVTTTPVTLDVTGSQKDMIVFINTSTAKTVVLPTPTDGRLIVVKDITGQAGTNNVTIQRSGSENIEGVAGNDTLSTNWFSHAYVSDGTDWYRMF